MYVDDLNIGEVHALETAQSLFSQNKEEKFIHARHCEKAFKNIKKNAEEIGMKINSKKTQLLCMSDSRFSNVSSHIIDDDTKVESVTSMKILGFVFGENPNVWEHVQYIVGKFNKAIWMLIHPDLSEMCFREQTEIRKWPFCILELLKLFLGNNRDTC